MISNIFIEILVLGAIGIFLVLGSVQDIIYRSVPNIIPLIILILSSASAVINNRIMEGLLVFILTMLASLFLYTRRAIGGADAKLLMSLAPLVPVSLMAFSLLWLAFFLLGFSLLYLFLNIIKFKTGQQQLLLETSIPFFVPVTFSYFFIIKTTASEYTFAGLF